MNHTPSSPSDIDRIRRLIQEVDDGKNISPEERTELLDVLGRHECWAPYFRLIRSGLEVPSLRQKDDYLRLAKVQNLYLEDVFAAAETVISLVRDLGFGFSALCEEVLPSIIAEEDYTAEATILGAVCDHFAETADRISCLERLCMLYEKKTHNESLLTQTYEKLLSIDPHNVKALRYFKLMFTQENEWEEVVAILKTLMDCVSHPQELFRVAQELAAIYLYQLDIPEDAIKVLERYCLESPLDTSTILYDAYHRLADWEGCLRVLRENLLSVDDDKARAILHFKMAKIHEHLDNGDAAIEDFSKSAKLWPQFLDPIEGIISVGVAKCDWPTVHSWLVRLAQGVKDEKLRSQLQQACKRLQDGIENAHQT